ncbi:MAG: glycosyltransferase [Candidatus Bathyarchaeia archaeon]
MNLLEATVFSVWMLTTLSACVYSLNFYLLLWFNRRVKLHTSTYQNKNLPFVSIHIPVYNENGVVEDTLKACLNLDYPKNLLEIIIVDDSTDETTSILRRYAEKHPSVIKLIHREERRGYKAGALQTALEISKGELIAVFDADTVPPGDFLKKTVKYFQVDKKVAFVQGRLESIGEMRSWITEAASIIHWFYRVFTQSVLFKGGLFIASVGSGVVYRRIALDEVGGWSWDTLAEDLDMSYRLQMKGWVGVFDESVVCRDRAPTSLRAFRTQYNRHVKGPVQNLKKHLLPLLFNKKISIFKRLEATLQLSAPLAFLMGQVSLLSGTLFYLVTPSRDIVSFWHSTLGVTVSVVLMVSFAAPLLAYVYGLRIGRLKKLSCLFMVGFILTDYLLLGSKSILETMLKKGSTWTRTPKTSLQQEDAEVSFSDFSDLILRASTSFVMLTLTLIEVERGLLAYSLGFLIPPLCWLTSAVIE